MGLNPLASELKQLNDRVYALERRGMYPPAVADSAWQTVSSFSNSWANFAGWPTAAYRIDSEGWVVFRGLLTGGANNTVAFTLPVGYRPAIAQILRTNCGDQPGYIVILPTGTVTIFGASLGYVALAPVMFPTWDTSDLRFERVDYPPYVGDAYNRFLRLVLRRSGMYELIGLSGPLTTGITASLNGNGPDLGDIYMAHGTSPNYGRIDLADNELTMVSVATLATWGIFGGIRWPSTTIEPLFSNLTLINGWANFGWGGSHYWGPARYYKDSNGYVHLRGTIGNPGGTATTTIANLPAGFRPGGRSMFAVWGTAAMYGVDVYSNGDVTPRNAFDRSAMSLAGISFLAEN